MPLKIHLLNKSCLSYGTQSRDLCVRSHPGLEMGVAEAKVGGQTFFQLSGIQSPHRGKGHLFENTLLSMLYLATGMCQALSQMAGSDSSHP